MDNPPSYSDNLPSKGGPSKGTEKSLGKGKSLDRNPQHRDDDFEDDFEVRGGPSAPPPRRAGRDSLDGDLDGGNEAGGGPGRGGRQGPRDDFGEPEDDRPRRRGRRDDLDDPTDDRRGPRRDGAAIRGPRGNRRGGRGEFEDEDNELQDSGRNRERNSPGTGATGGSRRGPGHRDDPEGRPVPSGRGGRRHIRDDYSDDEDDFGERRDRDRIRSDALVLRPRRTSSPDPDDLYRRGGRRNRHRGGNDEVIVRHIHEQAPVEVPVAFYPGWAGTRVYPPFDALDRVAYYLDLRVSLVRMWADEGYMWEILETGEIVFDFDSMLTLPYDVYVDIQEFLRAQARFR